MALASFHALVRIQATNSTAFRCLHRLAIHDYDRGTLVTASMHSCPLIDLAMNAGPHAGVLPRAEVVIYGAHTGKSRGSRRHWHPVRNTYKIASTTARRSVVRGRQTVRGGGNSGDPCSHPASVR